MLVQSHQPAGLCSCTRGEGGGGGIDMVQMLHKAAASSVFGLLDVQPMWRFRPLH